MTKLGTNTKSTRSITENNFDKINDVVVQHRSSKKIIPILKEIGLWDVVKRDGYSDGESLYLYIHEMENPPICASGNDVRFISFSVGYRYCGNASACVCTRNRVANAVSSTYHLKTDDAKNAIKEKRKNTISAEYGVENVFQDNTVKDKIRNTMVEMYGVENPMQLDTFRQKAIETNQQRYGVDNPAQCTEIAARTQETMLQKYGVDNPMLVDRFKMKQKTTVKQKYGVDNPQQNIEIRKKTSETIEQKYNVANVAKNNLIRSKISQAITALNTARVMRRLDDFVRVVGEYHGSWAWHEWECVKCNGHFFDTSYNGRIPRCPACYPKRISRPQAEIIDHLRTFHDGEIRVNDRVEIRPYELDIYIPALRVAIEFCGLYWHTEQKVGRTYHEDKLKFCVSKGIRLITIFEDEWLFKKDIVKSRLMHVLGYNPISSVFARKCDIVSVSYLDAAMFFDTNHIQGASKTGLNFGLVCNDVITAIMSFSKVRYEQKSNSYELVRFATNGRVVGGAGKLLAHFIQSYQPSTVISYADRRWSIGNVYEKIGFRDVKYVPAGYSYVKDKRRYSRQMFMKHKLIEQGYPSDLTEYEIMTMRGYDRIWDCGHLKYILEI